MIRIIALGSILLMSACQSRPKVLVRDGCLGGSVRIELLAFPGCPMAADLRGELARATDRHGLTFREVDQTSLDAGDARRAFPAPTILVDGRDLFPAQPMHDHAAEGLRCRSYPGGLPDSSAISEALRQRRCP